MKYKYFLAFLLIFFVIISSNTIFAADVNMEDVNNYVLNQEMGIAEDDAGFSLSSQDLDQLSGNNIDNNLMGDESGLNQENSHVIYVGQNTTDNGGNGSYENPFATLQLACNNVSGDDKVTINIFNGTYEIGSVLTFNTNNLFINGLGTVIIKNEKDANKATQAFSLSISSANFTMNNIIFDASHWSKLMTTAQYFTPFVGNANYGTYINCTFTGFKRSKLYGSQEFNSNFTNCTFEGFKDSVMFVNSMANNKFIYFENCIFIDNTINKLSNFADASLITVNGVWFGNTIPKYFNTIKNLNMKYANFSVSENYLSGNQFEIIGKLCWNGTDELVGDSFAPMTVTLSSSTGEIDSTATLENGIFRTIYNSTSIGNNIQVTLDSTALDLNFNIDNITIINEIINALNRNIESQAKDIDELNQNLTDRDAEISALNQNLTDRDAKIDELYQTINTQGNTTKLIQDLKDQIGSLNGTVNSQAGTIESQKAEIDSLNGTVNSQAGTIESQKEQISTLNETIIEQNKIINNTSNPIATSILVENITTTATTAKYFIISLIDANTNESLVNKTITLTVNGKSKSITTNESGIATVKVSYNTAGTRYYTFSFLGDEKYSASINTAKVVVNKKATKITAPKKTFKVQTQPKKVQVKLKAGKKVLKNKKVTLKVNGITKTVKTNSKGMATFKITKLTKKGTFKYTVKFAGDKAYKAVSKNGKITVK